MGHQGSPNFDWWRRGVLDRTLCLSRQTLNSAVGLEVTWKFVVMEERGMGVFHWLRAAAEFVYSRLLFCRRRTTTGRAAQHSSRTRPTMQTIADRQNCWRITPRRSRVTLLRFILNCPTPIQHPNQHMDYHARGLAALCETAGSGSSSRSGSSSGGGGGSGGSSSSRVVLILVVVVVVEVVVVVAVEVVAVVVVAVVLY